MSSEREAPPPEPRPDDRSLYVVPSRLRVCTGDELEPGAPGAWRVPGPLVVVLAPVLGGLFAVAFPLVVFFTALGVARERLTPRAVGAPVDWGLYVGLRRPRVVRVLADGAPLPGAPGARYVRAPRLALLLLSPVLGGLFVLVLPLLIGGALVLVPLAGLGQAAFGRSTSEKPSEARGRDPSDGADA